MSMVGFFSLAAAPFFLLPTFAAFANKKAAAKQPVLSAIVKEA